MLEGFGCVEDLGCVAMYGRLMPNRLPTCVHALSGVTIDAGVTKAVGIVTGGCATMGTSGVTLSLLVEFELVALGVATPSINALIAEVFCYGAVEVDLHIYELFFA